MNDFTLLTKEQIYQLDFLKKYGFYAELTDYCILLGGEVSRINENFNSFGYWMAIGQADKV